MVLIIAVFSLIAGSFMNNVISHFSGTSKFDLLRSHCMCGEKTLKALELVPVISYLVQKGKCNYCDKKISLRYPVIELSALTVGLIFYGKYGLTCKFIHVFCTCCLLLCIAAVDYFEYIIPNVFVVVLVFFSVLKAAASGDEFLLNIIVSFLLAVFLAFLNHIFNKIINKDIIGYGDIKLLAAINLFFGYKLFFFGLWLSAFIAIPGFYLIKLFSTKHSQEVRVPFGFFLSIGFIIISIFDKSILQLY